MGLAHDEEGIVDPLHALAAAELHRVFLHADGGLFQDAVHRRVHRHAVLLVAVIVHPQHVRIVVLHRVAELLGAVLEAGLAIEIDVVMAGEVVVHATRDGVLLRGAAAQQQQRHDTYRHKYVDSSMHCLFVV